MGQFLQLCCRGIGEFAGWQLQFRNLPQNSWEQWFNLVRVCIQLCNLMFAPQAWGALPGSLSCQSASQNKNKTQNKNTAFKWFGEEGKRGLTLGVTGRLNRTLDKMEIADYWRSLVERHVLVTSGSRSSSDKQGWGGLRAAPRSWRWLPGSCESSAFWKNSSYLFLRSPSGKAPSGGCVSQSSRSSHIATLWKEDLQWVNGKK